MNKYKKKQKIQKCWTVCFALQKWIGSHLLKKECNSLYFSFTCLGNRLQRIIFLGIKKSHKFQKEWQHCT